MANLPQIDFGAELDAFTKESSQSATPEPQKESVPTGYDFGSELEAFQSEMDKPKPQPSGIFRRAVVDPAIGLARGVPAISQAAIGLADLAMTPQLAAINAVQKAVLPKSLHGTADAFTAPGLIGRTVGKVADFRATDEAISSMLSPETQEAERRVQEATGLIGTLKAGLENPSAIVQSVGQSIPVSLLGGALGKLAARPAMAAAQKAAKLATTPAAKTLAKKAIERVVSRGPFYSAIGESGAQAGSITEQVRQETPGGVITPKTAALGAASGVTTGALGYLGNRLADALGFADINTGMVVGFRDAVKRNRALQVIGGMIQEGLFEEAGQSATEQIYQNIATGRPAFENVPNATAQGIWAGMAMGGGANLIAGRANATPTTTVAGQPAPAVESEATLDPETEALIVRLQEEQALEAERAARPPTPLPAAPGIGGYIAPEGAPVTPEAELDAVLSKGQESGPIDVPTEGINKPGERARRGDFRIWLSSIDDVEKLRQLRQDHIDDGMEWAAEMVARRLEQLGALHRDQAQTVSRPVVEPRPIVDEQAEIAKLDAIKAKVAADKQALRQRVAELVAQRKQAQAAPLARQLNDERDAKTLVDSGFAQKVSVIGSRATGLAKLASDTDILIDLGDIPLPSDSGAAEQSIQDLIESKGDGIRVGERDYFFKAGNRYFHLSSGAGMGIVENTEYGKASAGKPERVLAQRQAQTPSSGLRDNAIEGEVPAPHVQPASVSTPINSKTVAFDDVTKASDKNPYFIHITTPEAAKQILADRRIKAGQRGAFFWENGLDGASAEVMSEWLPDSPFVYIAIPKQGVSVAPDSWVKTGDAVVAGQDVALPPGTLVSSVETESNQKPDFNTLDAPPPPAEPAQGTKPPDSAQGIGGEPGSGVVAPAPANIPTSRPLQASLQEGGVTMPPPLSEAPVAPAVAPVEGVKAVPEAPAPTFTGKVGYRMAPIDIKRAGYVQLKEAAKGNTWSDGATVWDSAKVKSTTGLRAELMRHRAAYMPEEDQAAIRKAMTEAHQKRSAAARGRVGVMSDNVATERYAAQEMVAVRNGKDAPIDEQDMSDGGYVRIGERWFRVSVPEGGRGKTLTAANGEKIVLDLGESTDGKVAIPANSPNHAAIDAEFKAEVAATPQVPAPKIENDPFEVEREVAPPLTLETQTPEQVQAEREAKEVAAKRAQAEVVKPPSKPLDTTGDMFDQSKAENPLFATPTPKPQQPKLQEPLFAAGAPSTGVTRQTYDTAVASESRVLPMGEKAQAFDRLEDAPSDVRSAVAGGTAYVLGKDTQGQVRAVTLGDRSYFFLDRYANEGEIRQDIREEFFHRIENEYAGYGKASTLGTLTYGGKWSGIKNEITRNYGLRPGQEGFFRELAAKAYRDGLTDRTVWGKFLDAIVATVKATARRMGVKLDLSDAEIRDHVNGVLTAKMEGVVGMDGGGALRTSNATVTRPGQQPAYMVKAYHGTPHTFEPEEGAPFGRVKKEKVGTGEGAAAYGWGVLYTAQNREVADNYRKSLAPKADTTEYWEKQVLPPFLTKDEQYELNTIEDILRANQYEGRPTTKKENARYRVLKDKYDAYYSAVDKARPKGNLYHVELDFDPEDCLDWDKPLAEQSEKVKKALRDVIEFWAYREGSDPDALANMTTTMRGERLYNADEIWKAMDKAGLMAFDGDKSVSEYLASLGIKGIRYADQGSRYRDVGTVKYVDGVWMGTVSSADGSANLTNAFESEKDAREWVDKEVSSLKTHNYVVFNEDDIRVVGRNGETLSPTEAMQPKAQFARGEAPVTHDNITRINKDTITAEREARGYGPQPERVPVSDEALMQQTNDAIAADKSLMDRTVDDFQKEMRAPQPNELGILVRAKQDRRVELDKANADLDAAEKANDPAALKAARDRWAYADKRDREITQIFSVGGVGSQAGLLLQKFRIAIDDDFSVVHLQRSVESKQGWKPLNAKQKASIADIAKQYKNGERIVQERMAEHEAEVSKLRESRDIADELLTLADQELQDARLNEAFLRDVLDKMPEPDMSVPVSKTIQNDAKAAGQAARERMKARQSSVIDAEMLKDAFDVGYEFFIEEAVNLKASAKPKAGQQALFARGEAQDGVNPAWAEKMVAIYGEQIRPRLQEIQDAARKRFGYQQGLEAAKVRKPAAPRQPAPRKPGNVLDRAEITEMFKDQARAGVTDGKVALENVSRIVQEVYPDVSSEQVRDIFTGKDKEKGREPDLIVKATGDMRRQLQTITNIERLGKLLHPILFGQKRTKPSATARELMRKFNKLFKQAVKDGTLELDQDALDAKRASALDAAKTRINNRIEQLQQSLKTGKPYTVNNTPLDYDAEIKNLIALRDELQAAYDSRFKSEPLTYEQRVEQAVKATDRAIAAQQQKVDEAKAGKFKDTATGRASLWSPAIGERKLTLQALRDAYDELELAAFPPPTALQKAIDAKRKRYETATKEFNRRLREKDFAKRQVPHVDISGDKAALDALEQMGIAKARFLHEKRRAAWMAMGKLGKVGTLVGAVWDTSRDVLSSGELSAIGRQGYPAFFINPHAWIKANRAMFRSLSRESSKAVVQEFKQRKNYTNGFYKRGRLPISEDDGRGNYDKVDDRIKANIVNHIPILGASNRAYAAFLNHLRAELFDWLLAQHDSALNPSDALLREIGDTVGILTGKGRLGGSSEVLQRVVYAPSFFKSSFDIITGKPILGTSDKQLKWMMAKAYGKLLAGTGMIALLATIMGGDDDDDIEWDMTSADFGMVKVGHYKVGLFGFVRPLLTFLARQMTGYMKTEKGKVRLVDTLPPWTNPQGIAPKVRQGQDIDQVNWRFIKSKLHPAFSGVSAASTGRDFGGSPISREKAIMEMFTPITWKDLSEASKIETLDMMVLLTILMAAGFDVRMDYNDPVVKRYLDSKKKL